MSSENIQGDRLRIGVVGCGCDRLDVGNLMESGEVEIVGVADPSEKARESLRRRQPAVVGVPEFECAEELYSSMEFDGVFVGTPHTMHYSHVMGAITTGAHVICEKPLACTPEHTREIAAEARLATSL
ncbi:MAG: Gfo/Idh/MocA family oxidoreductase [Chloroflexia bacterium]